MGIQKDLHLSKNQPNIALTMFFIPYVLFEVPSNILMKKLTPHVWRKYAPKYCICAVLTWHSFCLHLGLRHRDDRPRLRYENAVHIEPRMQAHGCTVKDFGGLLATRFVLGLAEAGIFPGSKSLNSSPASSTDPCTRFLPHKFLV